MAEFLARLADCRRIDERHVGGRVRHQDGVKQRLVARLQIRQDEIFLQIVVKTGDLGVPARHLQLDRGDGGGQQTFETPGAPLGFGERGALVEPRIVQQRIASSVWRLGCGRLQFCLRSHLDCSTLSGSDRSPGSGRTRPRSAIISLVLEIACVGCSCFWLLQRVPSVSVRADGLPDIERVILIQLAGDGLVRCANDRVLFPYRQTACLVIDQSARFLHVAISVVDGLWRSVIAEREVLKDCAPQ